MQLKGHICLHDTSSTFQNWNYYVYFAYDFSMKKCPYLKLKIQKDHMQEVGKNLMTLIVAQV